MRLFILKFKSMHVGLFFILQTQYEELLPLSLTLIARQAEAHISDGLTY